MKRSTVANLIGVGFVITGLCLLLIASQVRGANARLVASPPITSDNSKPPAIEDPETIQGKPIALRISDLTIDNKIIDGVFDESSGEWTLTLDKVQHAVMTYQPNDTSGLTFMYGHNRKEVFSKLSGVREGMIAVVETDNGYRFSYRFVRSEVTKPEDISVFSYTGAPVLVLQTCTGLFYENRELYTFEFMGVENV